MTPDQRMKWDAEAAFKRDEIRLSLSAAQKRDGNGQICKEDLRRRIEAMGDGWRLDVRHKFGWTPAPTLAQLRKYEPPAKHGRDIESLMRYHEAHKKGRTDDDCLREKFGGSGDVRRATDTNPGGAASGSLDRGCSAAPTPLQSADGPWPKWVKTFMGNLCMFTGPSKEQGRFFGASGYSGARYSGETSCDFKGVCELSGNAEISESEAAQWLEQNGHKDAAAQLRGTPRADVATGGGRVWMNRAPRHTSETCYEHWRAALVDGRMYTRGAWSKLGVWSGHTNDIPSLRELESEGYPELFGPERDAILAECRKAMGV